MERRGLQTMGNIKFGGRIKIGGREVVNISIIAYN